MKVTIDSSEPLADALRVIGAVYNVSLAQVDEGPSVGISGTARTSERQKATGNGSRRTTDRKSLKPAAASKTTKAKRQAPAASSSDIRRWALANGQTVSSRGTLPAAVQAAYTAAHTG